MGQRIHAGLWLSTAAFILLFSAPVFSLNLHAAFAFVFLFACLLMFRLYDDLQQAKYDTGKPGRDYTNPEISRSLWHVVVVGMVLLAGFAYLIQPSAGLALVGFIVTNHLLYAAFVAHKKVAPFLPLLKYPFLYFLVQMLVVDVHDINGSQAAPAIGLFAAFIAFECMNDPHFPLGHRWSYVFQVLSFCFMLAAYSNSTGVLSFAILLAPSLLFNYMGWRRAPYLFFLFLLIFKLLITHEVRPIA